MGGALRVRLAAYVATSAIRIGDLDVNADYALADAMATPRGQTTSARGRSRA